MYSKNDFRNYKKKKQDDYLAHYGVKGMKWKQHKASIENHEDAASSFRADTLQKSMMAKKAVRYGGHGLAKKVKPITDHHIRTDKKYAAKHQHLANANRRNSSRSRRGKKLLARLFGR